MVESGAHSDDTVLDLTVIVPGLWFFFSFLLSLRYFGFFLEPNESSEVDALENVPGLCLLWFSVLKRVRYSGNYACFRFCSFKIRSVG